MPTRLWSHTLILQGNLDENAAPELEDELDCLRQEGVTTLTLDLRELEALEPRAAEVIAYQSALFKEQGRHFTVLAASPPIERALGETGGTDLSRRAGAEGIVARRVSSSPSRRTAPDVATTMIRDLGLI